MESAVNQLSLLDYILIVLSVVFSWGLQHRAHPPPTDGEGEAMPQPALAAIRDAKHVEPEPSEPQTPLGRTLQRICTACGYDGIAMFTDGARQAYETVVQAFASGNIAAQAYLLAEPVRQVFEQAIAASAQRGETTELTFIGFRSFEITDAQLDGAYAAITVKIEADMVSVTRDNAGQVVAGDPGLVVGRSEVWTFERELRATGPGWLLVATAPA